MATIGLRADVKKLFFDRAAVMKKLEAQKRRYYAKSGAFARTTARRSIRPSKYASKPGEPPKSKTGILRNNIFFAMDGGVVVGPARLSSRSGRAPRLLEFGGNVRATRTVYVSLGRPGRDSTGRFVQNPKTKIAKGTLTKIKARPYMAPTLRKTIPELPRLYAESVRRS